VSVQPNQVIEQIRFQLAQLNAKNADHDFEHLCRHLTRLRICSNVLPATGPVGGGGDQGRDFETFRTYLAGTSIAFSAFVGRASDKTSAFACTLMEGRKLTSKFKADIQAILAGGHPVDSVYLFCAEDYSVARRHKLQDWARTTYGLHLEIFDGTALSEMLAEPDVFWIAERYLDIPSELFPKPATDDWYSTTRRRWKDSPSASEGSFAEFAEVKAAARYATFDLQDVDEVAIWVERLDGFSKNGITPALRRRASYDFLVCSLRGLGALHGQENRVREYFSEISNLTDTADCEDAVVLLQYVIVAALRKHVDLPSEELHRWRQALEQRLADKLASAPGINVTCALLDTRGYFALLVDPRDPRLPSLSAAFPWWRKLMKKVGRAPLYPVARFSRRLNEFIKIFGSDHDVIQLARKFEELVGKRFGKLAMAQTAKERAVALYDAHQTSEALEEMYRALTLGHSAETLKSTVFGLVVLSQWYMDLGLAYAAKYYALAAAYLAGNSSDSDVQVNFSRGLFMGASHEFGAGNWAGYLDLLESGFIASRLFAWNAVAQQRLDEKDAQHQLQQTALLVGASRVLGGHGDKYVTERLRAMSLNLEDVFGPEIEPLLKQMSETGLEKLWARLEEQLADRPFGDLGLSREARWRAFGVEWKVEWQNEHAVNRLAEDFVAIFQLIHAAIASADIALLPIEVHVRIRSDASASAPTMGTAPLDGHHWSLTLPTTINDQDKFRQELVGSAMAIMHGVSLLPADEQMKMMERCFAAGLTSRINLVRPFSELYDTFAPKERFDMVDRASRVRPHDGRPFAIREHPFLAARAAPPPGHEGEDPQELVRRRYERVEKMIPYTLVRLRAEPTFLETVAKLHARGWKDWHILMAVANNATNYRVSSEKPRSLEEARRLFAEDKEEPDGVPPLSEFELERLVEGLRLTMLSTLKGCGLFYPLSQLRFDAIETFLSSRYAYWTVDCEHTGVVALG
jgi:hypothetical protein